MNKAVRTIFLTTFIVLLAVILMNAVGKAPGMLGVPKSREFDLTTYYQMIQQDQVKTASFQEQEVSGEMKDGSRYEVTVSKSDAANADLIKLLRDHGVKATVERPPMSQALIGLLSIIGLPIALLLMFYFFVVKPAQTGGNQAMSFGRSRAKRVGETGLKVTFDDVAGIDEVKQELFEIVDYLKNTKKYVALGAKIPKGILLTGEPGVGKTHLARAIAGEAGVPFYHISGSDFVEMFVGVGAARVRDLFETAKAHRPCLIFIDEIDAVGRQRGAGLGGGHDEREQTLNQLLVEMDGFDPNSGVIMIAATNRPDVLDPALLRPGRFDRQLVVESPDAKGREAILRIHAKGKPLDGAVNLATIGKRTPGFTGADLANALNEAALLAARRNRTKIGMDEVEEAIDRVMVGPARKSRKMIQKERELTAYHEAGHAIVGEILENCDPIHKVTILPRGFALGITWSLPEDETFTQSKSALLDRIAMSLAGLVAEEIVFGERFTGASGDLKSVTRIARAMVCEYGMSDKLGTLAIGNRSHNPFLGRDYHEDRNYSEEVAAKIDDEVRAIVEFCHQRATQILTEYREKLDALAQALLERETLNREEFLAVIEGRPLPEESEQDRNPYAPRSDSQDDDEESTKASGTLTPPRFEPA